MEVIMMQSVYEAPEPFEGEEFQPDRLPNENVQVVQVVRGQVRSGEVIRRLRTSKTFF